MKSLQKEQNSTNLLLWPPICRNKSAITPKRFNSLDTNSTRSSEVANGRNSKEMLIFQMGLWYYSFGISKPSKWQVFQILIINWQKFDGSCITPSYFPSLMQNGHFWPFSLIHSKGLEKSETMFLLFWKILYFSNSQMPNKTSITHSIYKIIHLKLFFKTFA